MELAKIITLVFGAIAGLWKLLDVVLKYKVDKKIKEAELKSIKATTKKDIVENWVLWSQNLEKRLEDTEKRLKESENLNKQMRTKMNVLERQVKALKEELKCFKKEENCDGKEG